MPIETPENRSLRAALWREGHDLGLAWYTFGDERQKRLHDERRGTGFSLSYQKLMAADLFGRIGSGKFVAFGFRTEPTVSDGPVVIPADVFDAPMTDDWREAAVAASGWRYERVTVLTLEEFNRLIAPATVDHSEGVVQNSTPDTNAPRKRRTDTWPWSSKALDELFKLHPELEGLSAAAIQDQFDEVFCRLFPELKGKLTPPRERTLREHLTKRLAAKIGD